MRTTSAIECASEASDFARKRCGVSIPAQYYGWTGVDTAFQNLAARSGLTAYTV